MFEKSNFTEIRKYYMGNSEKLAIFCEELFNGILGTVFHAHSQQVHIALVGTKGNSDFLQACLSAELVLFGYERNEEKQCGPSGVLITGQLPPKHREKQTPVYNTVETKGLKQDSIALTQLLFRVS